LECVVRRETTKKLSFKLGLIKKDIALIAKNKLQEMT
jgi:hypothetical protein